MSWESMDEYGDTEQDRRDQRVRALEDNMRRLKTEEKLYGVTTQTKEKTISLTIELEDARYKKNEKQRQYYEDHDI
jgi:hypothetical protein